MEHEFINEKLAYFRISKTDRVWFFKMGPEKTVKAIAVPDGSHFTLSGHTDREVMEAMLQRPFGQQNPCQVRCAVLSVYRQWL